jgi:hypothetical protein
LVSHARATNTRIITANQALTLVGNCYFGADIEQIRTAIAAGKRQEAIRRKMLLPGVIWAGDFAERRAEALGAPSGIICADLDHLNERLAEVRAAVVADAHTLAAFVSPSGRGLKILYRFDPTWQHLWAFAAASYLLRQKFGVEADRSCKDPARLCFLSADAELFVNELAVALPAPDLPFQPLAWKRPPIPGDPERFGTSSVRRVPSWNSLARAKALILIPTVAKSLYPDWVLAKSCTSPFRVDHKPSFSVYDGGRRWYDHGTGEGGDVVDFISRALGQTTSESARFLIWMAATGAFDDGDASGGRP